MYHGIINIYKEAGYTSHDVVAKLRGILKQKKIGHTGTLDPAAEGVLPVCLGKGTRLCDMLTEKTKTYRAVMLLGVETDTQDTTGEILSRRTPEEIAGSFTEEEIRAAAECFIGPYAQIPPMYSALKVNGRKLCDLAREGVVVERKARPVEILSLVIENVDLPRVTMTVCCSKGTYIRTLCHDIGESLGCGACMESLLRTRSGIFCLEDSLKLDEVERLQSEGLLPERIIPIEDMFRTCPKLKAATPLLDKLLSNGNPFTLEQAAGAEVKSAEEAGVESAPSQLPLSAVDGTWFRVYDSGGRFIGVYEYRQTEERWQPKKIFLGGD